MPHSEDNQHLQQLVGWEPIHGRIILCVVVNNSNSKPTVYMVYLKCVAPRPSPCSAASVVSFFYRLEVQLLQLSSHQGTARMCP